VNYYDNATNYTKEFAEEFVMYAEEVMDYIDNECLAEHGLSRV
jgi:HEPN domain-containing protein